MGALRDGAALTDILPTGKVAPTYFRSQMGAPTDITGARAAVHTVCAVPFPIGDDAGRAMAMFDRADDLPMKCLQVDLTGATGAQTAVVRVPTAWTVPPP
jgi:hypothetical protein